MKNLKITILISISMLMVSCQTKTDNKMEGKVKRETLSIASKVPGRIEKILVKESEWVNEGDTLAIISVPEIKAKLSQAEGAYIAAKAQYQMSLNGATKEQVRQAVAGFDVAREQFELAEKSLNRIENLYQDSLISAQKYDETLMKYKAAKIQLEAAEAKKEEVMIGVRNEKIKMAEGDLLRAEGAFKEAEIAYNERYIIAPKTMSIETITLHEGELALPGYNLFIGYTRELFFRITVREAEIHKYCLGQKHNILNPFTDKKIESSITAIKQLPKYAEITSSYPNYEIGESVFEIKLKPDNADKLDELYNNSTILLTD